MSEFNDNQLNQFRICAWIVYITYAVSILLPVLGFLIIIGAILAHTMEYEISRKYPQSYLLSHFKWQIKTFWFSLVGYVLGVVVAFVGFVRGLGYQSSTDIASVLFLIGIALIIITMIWSIYRIVRGAIKLWLKNTV